MSWFNDNGRIYEVDGGTDGGRSNISGATFVGEYQYDVHFGINEVNFQINEGIPTLPGAILFGASWSYFNGVTNGGY